MICSLHKILWSILIVFFAVQTAWAFSFVVFGDNRDGDEIFKDLIQKINLHEPDVVFAVNTGDLVPAGQKLQYEHYLKLTSKLKIKVYNVIGNHELVRGGGRWFDKFIGPRYYSWDYENCHFICLDNVSQLGLGNRQLKWLKEDLSRNSQKLVFVFLHKPLSDPTGSFSHYVMRPHTELDMLKGLFKKNNVKYVVCGHIHGYGRIEEDGIVYIVTGGAGAPLYLPNFSGGFYNYVKFTVQGNKFEDKVIRLYD